MWKLNKRKVVRVGFVTGLAGVPLLGLLHALGGFDTRPPSAGANAPLPEQNGGAQTSSIDFRELNNHSSPDPQVIHGPTQTPSMPGASSEGTNSADALYAALYSENPEERLHALDSIWQSAETFYSMDKFIRRIEELSVDRNAEVSEFAQLVGVYMAGIRGTQEADTHQDQTRANVSLSQPDLAQAAAEPNPEPENPEHPAGEGANFSTDANIAEQEKQDFAQLRERALHDPEASERAQALEEAVVQHDERVIDLLSQALRDTEADNRMVAVDGLRQLLEEGFGDVHRIVGILQESTGDQDPEVAEAAQQVIRERPAGAQAASPDALHGD